MAGSRRLRTLVTAGVTAVVVIALLPLAPARADSGAPPVQYATYFNAPGPDGEPDGVLENVLVSYIDQAVPGSTMRAAVQQIGRDRLSDALIRAYQRGVDVQLVLDKGAAPLAQVIALRAALPASAVTVCSLGAATGPCIGPNNN